MISWLLVIILVGGGLWGFQGMGKLEDPAFTVKVAKVITYYPGASAQQVQDEVTYHIEEALQLMEQVKWIKKSISRPGMSDITVEFQDKYRGPDFPNIYDELRRKIADMKHQLPPGAQAPIVVDSFADVYGIYVTLSGEGYSWRDLWDTADDLKKQLILVPGVRKIVIDGEQQEVAYLTISRARLGELGIPVERIASVLKSQNVVADAGNVAVGDEYLRIWPTGESDSVQSIGDVLIASDDKKLVRLSDIAEIQRAYQEVPAKYYYNDGRPALALGISIQAGQNVVAVGEAVDRRLAELQGNVPVGMALSAVYDQPKEVDQSVNGFIVSVGQAVVIVLVVLLLFMGLRVGLIIGATLLITVAGTLFIMALYGIELQRISLGALVIALGMLVDNAIVVAEGMLVRMNAGMKAPEAAREAVGKTMWALLGGTVIGILAFAGIGFSPDNTGEFAGSLFYVILISLQPVLDHRPSAPRRCCAACCSSPARRAASSRMPTARPPSASTAAWSARPCDSAGSPWASWWGCSCCSLWGFGFVKQAFFPYSNTPLFFVDIWEPQGTDIRKTREDTLRVSEYLRGLEGVEQTTSVIGGPHQRFTLVYDAKEASPAYAQIIVRTDTRERIDAVWDQVDAFLKQELYWTDPILKRMMIGPGRDSKIEARFHGPDAAVLRELAGEAKAIMRAEPGHEGGARRLARAGQGGAPDLQRAGRPAARDQPRGPRRRPAIRLRGHPGGAVPRRQAAVADPVAGAGGGARRRGQYPGHPGLEPGAAAGGARWPGGERLRDRMGKSGHRRARPHADHHRLLQSHRRALAGPLFERLRPQIEAIDAAAGLQPVLGRRIRGPDQGPGRPCSARCRRRS